MNTHTLAAEIVTKLRNSMQDSATNQCTVVENLIRETVTDNELIVMSLLGVYRAANVGKSSFAAQGHAMDGYSELAAYREIAKKAEQV